MANNDAVSLQNPFPRVPSCAPSWLPNPDTRQNFFGMVNIASNRLSLKILHEQDQNERKRSNPLGLAYEMKRLLDSGEVRSKAEIARRHGWSRARVTQIMNLLKLPQEVQAALLDPLNQKAALSERALRKVLKVESSEERDKALPAFGLGEPTEFEL